MTDSVGETVAATLGLLRLMGSGLEISAGLITAARHPGATEHKWVPIAHDSSWQSLHVLHCVGLPLSEEEQADGNDTVTLDLTGVFRYVLPRPATERVGRELPAVPFPLSLVRRYYPQYPRSGEDHGLVPVVALSVVFGLGVSQSFARVQIRFSHALAWCH